MKDHIFYFHYLLTHFNVTAIVGDYNGGVQFLSACNESALFKKSNLNIQTIDVNLDNPEDYQKALREVNLQYDLKTKRICILRKPSSQWIRTANELLQSNFDHRRVFFASRAINDDYNKQRSKKIPIAKLKFLRTGDLAAKENNAAKMIDFIEHQYDTLELTKTECALIQITTSPQGTQTFNLPQNLKRQTGPDKARKDSYSALVLGNWMVKVYYDFKNLKPEDVQHTFTPMFIA